MTEMESDIYGLDADLQAKTACMKLAHTRLENRTSRPGMDLCRDEVLKHHSCFIVRKILNIGRSSKIPDASSVCLQVQRSLVSEVHQLQATITALKLKLSDAR